MEERIPNISDLNRNNKPVRPQRKGPFYIFAPLVVNYGVSFVVQMIFSVVLFIGVFTNFAQESTEFQQILSDVATDTEMTSMEELDSLITPELTSELTEKLIAAVEANIALLTILCAVATIPVFIWLMKRDDKYFKTMGVPLREKVEYFKYPLLIMGSVAVCVALNNVLTLSQLAEISVGYQESSSQLYSISFPLQLIGLGIITPIAEELVFRGVIYNRIKLYFTTKKAMIYSAVIFGLYHSNLVQLIYAGLCGIVLVWVYERYGSLKAPILVHIGLNMTSLVLTQYEAFIWMFSEPIRMTIITVLCAAVSATMYVVIHNMTVVDIGNNE